MVEKEGKPRQEPGRAGNSTSNTAPLYNKLSSLLTPEQHRYKCRTCRNNCELIVQGKITRIRQLCLQFQSMDGYCLWSEQPVVR